MHIYLSTNAQNITGAYIIMLVCRCLLITRLREGIKAGTEWNGMEPIVACTYLETACFPF